MTSREADGSDKIAAFERGISEEQAHLAFETSGVHAVIVDETYLVAYNIRDGVSVTELLRLKLYDNGGDRHGVRDFLAVEAHRFQCSMVIGIE